MERIDFKPFDPATKRAEAVYRDERGRYGVIVKGAPAVVAKLAGAADTVWQPQAEAIVGRGQRVLGVAEGDGEAVALRGSAGAGRRRARGFEGRRERDPRRRRPHRDGDGRQRASRRAAWPNRWGFQATFARPKSCMAILAATRSTAACLPACFPEDKFRLVRAFQRRGEVVGMSGDGVNDAPALRQAEAGVAVANATDVAKAAAAMVLTTPGLGGVVPAIETSRRVFQRIITYTLNMLIKKIEMMALLVIGFLVTRHKPLTPMLMVLVPLSQ